jgi:uncharacterized coiled-coil DUF342 family protein
VRGEFSRLVEERRKLISEIRDLRAGLREAREGRARLVDIVRDLRNKLREARERFRASISRLDEIRKAYPDLERLAGVSIASIKKRIDSLEWKIITGQIDPEEEEDIIRNIARLEAQLNKILKAKNAKNTITEIRAEIASARIEIEDIKRAISEVFRGIEKFKAEESQAIAEIERRRARLEEISRELDRLSAEREKIYEEIKRKKEEINSLRSKLKELRAMSERKSRAERLRELRKRAEEKLASGDKLTFEELQALYGVEAEGGSEERVGENP